MTTVHSEPGPPALHLALPPILQPLVASSGRVGARGGGGGVRGKGGERFSKALPHPDQTSLPTDCKWHQSSSHLSTAGRGARGWRPPDIWRGRVEARRGSGGLPTRDPITDPNPSAEAPLPPMSGVSLLETCTQVTHQVTAYAYAYARLPVHAYFLCLLLHLDPF